MGDAGALGAAVAAGFPLASSLRVKTATAIAK
jgi:hypothetical protein